MGDDWLHGADEKYSELLGLCFKNEYGEKCNVFILNAMGKLKMKFESDEYEPFDAKKLVFKIIGGHESNKEVNYNRYSEKNDD